jgi:5-methylcytosine-specific restriction protein A
MTKRIYSTATWRKVRLAVLERDRYICQLRLEGCTTTATCVDHKIEVSRGGAPYEMWNLRASCNRCNLVRRNRSVAADAKRARQEKR